MFVSAFTHMSIYSNMRTLACLGDRRKEDDVVERGIVDNEGHRIRGLSKSKVHVKSSTNILEMKSIDQQLTVAAS